MNDSRLRSSPRPLRSLSGGRIGCPSLAQRSGERETVLTFLLCFLPELLAHHFSQFCILPTQHVERIHAFPDWSVGSSCSSNKRVDTPGKLVVIPWCESN